MTTLVIEDQILVALKNDPRFDDVAFDVLACYVPKALVAAIGNSLDRLVTLQEYLEIAIVFLHGLIGLGFASAFDPLEGDLIETLYLGLAAQLEELIEDLPSFLDARGLSEEEALLSGKPIFNDELAQAFRASKLTFRVLITIQPGVFVPSS